VRVYLDRTVPKTVVAQLEALGAQLKWMDDASMSGGIHRKIPIRRAVVIQVVDRKKQIHDSHASLLLGSRRI
jgi:hypothetical protein